MKKLHHRMPVILEPEDYAQWLDCEYPPALEGLLRPIDSKVMTEYQVSREVNSPRNDNPEVIEPIGGTGTGTDEQDR